MSLITLKDFETYAEQHLDRKTWIFYSQGAERNKTRDENERAFTRYHLIPRMLRNVADRDLSVTVLGERLDLPIGAAPSAYQKLAHPDGELAAAAAAAEMGIIYTLSTVATSSIEDVAKVVNGISPLWLQVYVLEERKYTEEMIKRAEARGYKALVLTVDCPVNGVRHEESRDALKLPPHLRPVNVIAALKGNDEDYQQHYASNFCKTLTWEDIAWIKSISSLPVVLKGILSAEDAVRANSLGVAAVWVSNHGGRQLDGVAASIDALPAISRALKGSSCEVYVDGGVRWGSDILKALALGARAVFVGRPILWGLAHSGKDGVRKVIGILKEELDRTMHLAGCKDIQDIGPHLVKRNFHSRL